MTYTDEQVAQYFAENPGLSENQIAQVMRETGVSPEQVARVTQADPGYVSQRYNQYLDLVDQARVSTNIPAASSSGLTFLNAPRDTGLRPSSGVTGAGADVVSSGPPASVNPVSGLSLGAPSNVTVGPQPEPYVDTVAQNLLGRFDQEVDAAMASGDYANVANVIKEAEGLYGPSAYSAVADYLNTNPRYEGLRGQVGGAVYTPENLQSFVSSIPAPVDPGIATVLPDNQTSAQTTSTVLPDNQTSAPTETPAEYEINSLFREFLGRAPRPDELSTYLTEYGSTVDANETNDWIKRSQQEILNRQNPDVNKLFKGDNFPTLDQIRQAKIDGQARVDQEVEDKAAAGVYQPTYTSYRQEGQAPFGGYYALPGIGPYGGVFGVGTEGFEQQSDPFSGAQARAQEMIRNRISPSTVPLNFDSSQADPLGAFNLSVSEGRFQDAAQIAQRSGYSPDVVADYINANRSGLNLDSDFGFSGEDAASFYSTTGFPRQPAAFGGSMSSMGTPSNPFIYRQSLSPLPLPVPEAVSVAETVPASEGSATMRRGGYINQGITAVRR
jgi:hypothetical protein